MAVTQTNLMNMPVPNLMADGSPDAVDRTLPDPFLPSKAAPAGTMWMLNPNSNEYELVANPDWKPEQMNSVPSGMFAQTNLSQAPQFTVGQQPQQPSIVSGLFGDEIGVKAQQAQYLQDRQQAMQAQALQFAQLDPMARAQYSLYLGGQQLGGAVGGALGAQDPQLQLIAQRSAITSQIDMNDPDSIFKAATRAVQIGDTPYANALADRAKALREAQVKQLQEASTATKNLAEATKIKGETGAKEQAIKTLQETYKLDESTAIAVANNPDLLKTYLQPKSAQAFKLLETGKYTADSVALWETGKGELEPIDKMAKPDGSFLSKAQELKIGVKPKFGDYTPEETGKINAALLKDQVDLAAAKATSIRISNNVQQEKAFSEKRGTTQATELDAATNLARGASQALTTIRSMKSLNDSGQLFTGPVAQSYVGATNLLSSLNLLSPAQAKMLTSSQVYDKQAKDLVMNELAGKLGAGISEGDRKFIEDRIPQLTTSPAARKELLDKIEKLQEDKITYWKKMTAHANKYNNLNDFDFSENYSPSAAISPATGGNWSIKPKP
jgi:hypothetical protein